MKNSIPKINKNTLVVQVYCSNGSKICWDPLLTFPVLANEAREICILMKQLRPDWDFRVSEANKNGWSFGTDL